jgi:hypothetical protein
MEFAWSVTWPRPNGLRREWCASAPSEDSQAHDPPSRESFRNVDASMGAPALGERPQQSDRRTIYRLLYVSFDLDE